MMKKKKDNDLVTKGFLKSYLTRKLNQFEMRLEKRLDFKMEQKFKEFKNDILAMKDAIIKEIRNMREEFEAHRHSHSRIDETLEDHETRLKTLETP